MTISISQAFSRAGASAIRSAPRLTRTAVFSRLYIVATCAAIVAIGGCGFYAIVQGRTSDAVVARTFAYTSDANDLGAGLDREYAEVLAETRQHDGGFSDRFARGTRLFDAARIRAERDAGAGGEPLLKSLELWHAAFVADSLATADAVAQGDRTRATTIEASRVAPNVGAMRYALGLISARLLDGSRAEAARQKALEDGLLRLIGAVTLFGLALVGGLALLLGRYQRSAEASSAATLAALEQAALTDSLTVLGNNRSFYDDFDRELARAKRHDESLVLALIDVDDFKAVNDEGGHSHGDTVLAQVGDRLRGMRQEDRAYRIGGDEFALLLVETGSDAAAIALARLQNEIRESGLGATVSIGYVNLAGEQLVAESYELADTALYEAKRMGRNQTVCFGDINGTVNVFSPRKADAVRKMIAHGLVSTAFQPIWDIQSTQPLGFEALARPFPELGFSGPQEAFDIAQRIRELPALDRLCAQKSLEAAGNLPPDSVIFLNYSPASLAHASFDPRAFVETVRAAGLVPEQLVIEVTERRIDDPDDRRGTRVGASRTRYSHRARRHRQRSRGPGDIEQGAIRLRQDRPHAHRRFDEVDHRARRPGGDRRDRPRDQELLDRRRDRDAGDARFRRHGLRSAEPGRHRCPRASRLSPRETNRRSHRPALAAPASRVPHGAPARTAPFRTSARSDQR